MLRRLDISNYALIENVNLILQPGFTVITGETGAGKSILLKALALLLGERADIAVLKQSEKKCILEAEFDIAKLGLESFFTENELDYDIQCIIRREFNTLGKSRAFVNDTPVQLNTLKSLGEKLISIHTQHQTLEILSPEFQMDVLDHFCGIDEAVNTYKSTYKSYREKVNTLIEMQVKDRENRKEKDYLIFLLNELEAANLAKLDLTALRQKSAKIENFEKIQSSIQAAQAVLEDEHFSPSFGVKKLIEAVDELKKMDASFADLSARLWSIKIELDDIETEISNQDTDLSLSDEEVTEIRQKIEEFNALSFKHNLAEVSQLIELQNSLQTDLDAISNLENAIEKLEKEMAIQKKAVLDQGKIIREKRLAALPLLTAEVKNKLHALAMPNAEMEITLTEKGKPGLNGLDQIEFLFKTNLGGSFSPIRKVASGGELSRLMLAILSLLSEKKNLPTLVFDEIDTGVSGEVATKIAQEFETIGKRIQVIAITHLAQVAGKGHAHLHVSKQDEGNKTSTYVKELGGDSRIDVLAAMLSGEKITAAAKENAANLLSNN